MKEILRSPDADLPGGGSVPLEVKTPEKREVVLSVQQKEAKEIIIHWLAEGGIYQALQLKDMFPPLPETVYSSPEVQQAAKEGMIRCLTGGGIVDALKIKDQFSVPEEVAQQVAKEGMIQKLTDGYIDDALRIRDQFSVQHSFPEFQQTVKDIAINCMADGFDGFNFAIKIRDAFSIKINCAEIAEKLPGMKEFFEKIDKISPVFRLRAEKSEDLLFSLFEFIESQEEFLKIVEKNPFLGDAIIENPRMGSKLLIKFPEFDQLSKENISTLFQAKKEILAQNPEIDPASPEFRQLMQERLKEYKNNPKVFEAAEAEDINMDQWLNYSKEEDFTLGAEKLVPFTEMVKTPITRMQETLEEYQGQLKAVLGGKEYRPILEKFKISSEDIEELKKQKSEMEQELQKAQERLNISGATMLEKEKKDLEKKVKGTPRGIASLTARIEKPKMVGLWDKLMGDYDAIAKLQKDLFRINNSIAKAEQEELKIGTDKEMPAKDRRRALQKAKADKEKLQYEFQEKFEIMNRRLTIFREALPGLVSPCLGEERTASLLQEIKEQTEEQFNHYQTDKSTLENILMDDEKKEKLDGRAMSMGLWSRNPDVDLYLGNYTACCICIDSMLHRAESPISDYLTDIGIQVVTITDRKTGNPVVAAWCWLGKNGKGKIELVIDNIEADTKYSAPYKVQLEAKMKEYIEQYAKACNIKIVSQGKDNNDLVAAKLKEDCVKLGGSSRLDGYFLEAELDNNGEDDDEDEELEGFEEEDNNDAEMQEPETEEQRLNRRTRNLNPRARRILEEET